MSPIYTQFFVDSNNVTVYESEIFYQRGGVEQITKVNAMNRAKNT